MENKKIYNQFEEVFNKEIDALIQKYSEDTYLEEVKSEFNKNCDCLKNVISLYLDGYSGKAYIEFSKAMSSFAKSIDSISNSTIIEKDINELNEKLDNVEFESISRDDLKTLVDSVYNILKLKSNPEKLFRLRTSDSKKTVFKSENLFHIPFDSFNHIKGYRFSIEGFPCLYLGSSFLCCYDELSQPNIEDIWFMELQLKRKINYIDLTLRPEDLYKVLTNVKENMDIINIEFDQLISQMSCVLSRKERRKNKLNHSQQLGQLKREMLNKNNDLSKRISSLERFNSTLPKNMKIERDDIEQLLQIKLILEEFELLVKRIKNDISNSILLMPLTVATSIPKSNDNNVFNPEYIIPQFLMQWIRGEKKYHCVKYFSTKKSFNIDDCLYYNYAFPTRIKEEKYCSELMDLFELKDPQKLINVINWNEKLIGINTDML